jgi:hypothetical protein
MTTYHIHHYEGLYIESNELLIRVQCRSWDDALNQKVLQAVVWRKELQLSVKSFKKIECGPEFSTTTPLPDMMCSRVLRDVELWSQREQGGYCGW